MHRGICKKKTMETKEKKGDVFQSSDANRDCPIIKIGKYSALRLEAHLYFSICRSSLERIQFTTDRTPPPPMLTIYRHYMDVTIVHSALNFCNCIFLCLFSTYSKAFAIIHIIPYIHMYILLFTSVLTFLSLLRVC